MIKTVGEFVKLVSHMRTAQKRYFRSRVPSDLDCSKALERQVDQAVEQWEKRREERIQPGLGL